MSATVETMLQTLARTAQVVLPLYQQRELMQLNIKRAEQNLPPINPADYAAGVNVGLSDDTRKLVYYGIAGLFAWLILRELGTRRK